MWPELSNACALAVYPAAVGTVPAIRPLRGCPPLATLCGEGVAAEHGGAQEAQPPAHALRARPAAAGDLELLWG